MKTHGNSYNSHVILHFPDPTTKPFQKLWFRFSSFILQTAFHIRPTRQRIVSVSGNHWFPCEFHIRQEWAGNNRGSVHSPLRQGTSTAQQGLAAFPKIWRNREGIKAGVGFSFIHSLSFIHSFFLSFIQSPLSHENPFFKLTLISWLIIKSFLTFQ